MKIKLIIYISFINIYCNAQLKILNPRWQKIQTTSDIGFNEIYGIETDSLGYLYLGTDDGLYYYNGKKVTPYDKQLVGNNKDVIEIEKIDNKIVTFGYFNNLDLKITDPLENNYEQINTNYFEKILLAGWFKDSLNNIYFLARDKSSKPLVLEFDKKNKILIYLKNINNIEEIVNFILKSKIKKNNYKNLIYHLQKINYVDIVLFKDSFLLAQNKIYKFIKNDIIEILDIQKYKLKGKVFKIYDDSCKKLYFSIRDGKNGLYQYDYNTKTIQLLFDNNLVTGITKDKLNNLVFSTLSKSIFTLPIYEINLSLTLSGFNKNGIKSIIGSHNNILIIDNENNFYLNNCNTKLNFKYNSGLKYPNYFYKNEKNEIEIIQGNKKLIYNLNNKIVLKNINFENNKDVIKVYSLTKNNSIIFSKYNIGFDNNNKQILIKDKVIEAIQIKENEFIISTYYGLYSFNTNTYLLTKIITNTILDNNKINKMKQFGDELFFLSENTIIYKKPENKLFKTLIKSNDNPIDMAPFEKGIAIFYRNKVEIVDKNGKEIYYKSYNTELQNEILKGGIVNNNKIYTFSNNNIYSDSIIYLKNKNNIITYLKNIIYGDDTINNAKNNKFEFKYKGNNNITINFDVFNTYNYENINYSIYKKDENIIYKNTLVNNEIKLFDLKPDEYKIILFQNNKILSQSKVIINPLIYQTLFFNLAIILLSLYLIILLYNMYLKAKNKKIIESHLLKNKILVLESSSKLNQLKPHFIFNAMGPLQEYMMQLNNPKGLQYFHHLSDLLRQMITMSRNNDISLKNELSFIINYLEVQKLEKPNTFDYEIKINIKEEYLEQITIPNLLIQPLIENAIDYGMTNDKKVGGKINLNIELNNNFISIEIIDNGNGFDEKNILNKKDNAINIIKERLNLLTPKGKIKFYKLENEFIIQLQIPILNNKNY